MSDRYPPLHRESIPGVLPNMNELLAGAVRSNTSLDLHEDLIVDGLTVRDGVSAFYPAPAADAGLDSYPPNVSTSFLSSASGWPIVTGIVETFVRGAGTAGWRAHQIIWSKTTARAYERYSTDGVDWDNWRLMQPIKVRDATSTQYDVVSAATVETARTVTVWNAPPDDFEAEIHVTWQMWATNPTAVCDVRAFVEISRDAGSSWTSGLKQLDHVSAASEFGSLTVHALASGAVTDDIQARLRVQSSHADTKFDDMDMIATIGANY